MYIFSIPRYAVKPTMNPDLLWALLNKFYPPKSLLIHLGKLRGLPVIHSNNAIPVKK